jgi:hypothetical protein
MVLFAKLYFNLGAITINYESFKNFIIWRLYILLMILVGLLAAIIYEIYQKINNIKYEIKLIKEENEYKIKILEK